MLRVSINKIGKIAQPLHAEWLDLISKHTADLSATEQITTILMIMDVMRCSLIELCEEEDIVFIEDSLKKFRETL